MKENTIKILKIEVGKEPYEKEINNDLKSLQREVGGLVQPVEIGNGCLAAVNEEGKLNGSQPNRWLGDYDIICGDFFICGDGEEDFTSLTDAQMETCKQTFGEVPAFSGEEQELEPKAFVIGFDFY
ncbi:DUF3846 domain-containing protein [Chakrabartyella piscis]|uniref:DUF3846 domain-containing protein n=1 Tax=Chakrabartyella piscis TaxID=2918914 RepID=UPI0029586952|nr:DUF3846 domain-containing protein [Chakrabartyella piscis]